MNTWELLLIAVGLSMDAAAVSITNTLFLGRPRVRDVLLMCGAFALFQCAMPVIGYFCASFFRTYIMAFDHWIALMLLGFIGVKMIVEGLRSRNREEKPETSFRLSPGTLLMQAIATSIDALAVGISFSALAVDLLPACVIITAVTFLICLAAILTARRIGGRLNGKTELIGGLILVGIGVKILIEHLVTGT